MFNENQQNAIGQPLTYDITGRPVQGENFQADQNGFPQKQLPQENGNSLGAPNPELKLD